MACKKINIVEPSKINQPINSFIFTDFVLVIDFICVKIKFSVNTITKSV